MPATTTSASVTAPAEFIFQVLDAGDESYAPPVLSSVIIEASAGKATMTLRVPCFHDGTYYNVVGVKDGANWIGDHVGEPGDVAVHATWAQLGEWWVGTWTEGRKPYFFMFRIVALP